MPSVSTTPARETEAEKAGWTLAESIELYPCYRMERRRLLKNAICARSLSSRLGIELLRSRQLNLARLRSSWKPIRAILAKATGAQS